MLLFMQKIAIIIPCYNEEKRLDERKVSELLSLCNIEIYFANDGSKDNTLILLNQIKRNHQNIKILDFKKNEGKANTIYKTVKLLLEKKYDYIGYLDADFATSPIEFSKLIYSIEQQNNKFVIASRVLLLNSKITRKWHRHIIGRVIITVINLKFKLGIYDTQCGAKIFSTELLSKVFTRPFYSSWLFDIEIFIRLKKHNLLSDGKEIPITEWTDIDGSKLGWKTSFKILKELILINLKY